MPTGGRIKNYIEGIIMRVLLIFICWIIYDIILLVFFNTSGVCVKVLGVLGVVVFSLLAFGDIDE